MITDICYAHVHAHYLSLVELDFDILNLVVELLTASLHPHSAMFNKSVCMQQWKLHCQYMCM